MADENQYPEGDTRNQTWPEYFKKTLGNVSGSLQKYGSGLVHSLEPENIPETIGNMGSLARGTFYNVTGYKSPHAGEPMPATAVTPTQQMFARMEGYGVDPAQIKREQEIASDVAKGIPPFAKYTAEGGWQGRDPEKYHEFGQRFQEDPIGTASLASIPISGAGGTLSKVAGAGSKLADTAKLSSVADALDFVKTAGNVAEKTKYADPATAGLGLAGAAKEGVVNAASYLSDVADFKPIMDLYAKSGRDASKLRSIFDEYSSGGGNYEGLMQDVKDWFKGYRQNKVDEWASKKADLNNKDIPLTDVLQTTADQIQGLGSQSFKISPEARSAIDFLSGKRDPKTGALIEEGLIEKLHQIDALPPGHPEKTLLALDKQKQHLWDLIVKYKKENPALSEALVPIHNKLVESLTKYGDSSYGTLMKEFADIENEMGGISAATGSNMNKVSQFRRIMGSRKNPVGKSYLDIMSEQNPEIGAALLGSSSSSSLFPRRASWGDVATIPASLMSGFYHLPTGVALAAAEVGKLGLSTPRITTGVAKTLGALDRYPLTSVPKSVIAKAPEAARAIAPFQGAMESAYERRINKMQEEDAKNQLQKWMEEDAAKEAAGGRIGRATGGRTGKNPNVKAMQLITMVDRIKKQQGKETEPLLNLDDTTVAKALEIANRGI